MNAQEYFMDKEVKYPELPTAYSGKKELVMMQFHYPNMGCIKFRIYLDKEDCPKDYGVAIFTIKPKEVIPNYDSNYAPCI